MHLSNNPRLADERAAAAPAWLDGLRKAGVRRFEQVGFPNTKQEEWRHTNVAAIARTKFVVGENDPDAAAPLARELSFGDEAVAELVFVNGHFSPQLSKLEQLPRGVTIRSLAEAIEADDQRVQRHLARVASVEQNPFVALNTGYLRDGAYLHFARGTTVSGPIHLLFVSTSGSSTDGQPSVSHPRTLVLFDDNVEATLVETYAGTAGTYFTNAVTEIVVGADCRIDHCKMQQESLGAYHVATQQTTLGCSSTFVSHSTTLGGRLTRNDLNCVMAGQGAYAILNGLVIIGGTQHVDNHTLLDHAEPNCPSHELYKHVLSDKATGVFKGKILVRQPAQKTDSKQSSKSLLLSDDATMNSQPALEIYADDVKCTHGSTTGPVDEDMIFYLRTRGVGIDAARHLLTYAFAADVTRRIKVGPVRRRIEDFMAAQHGLPQDLRITDLGAFDEAVL
jgi:Fe-S cluster assembly protein SufD